MERNIRKVYQKNRRLAGKRAAKKAKELYGEDYHRRIGLKGGNPVLLELSKKNAIVG